MALRILSYNIHGLPWIHVPIEAIFLWAYVKCHTDIICFQEVFSRKLRQKIEFLAPKYGFHAFFPADEPRCIGKPLLGFFTPCGLCILVKKTIPIVNEPRFVHFHNKGGLDSLVNKGILSLGIQHGKKQIQILNTHFQADFTEIPCCSIDYDEIRNAQEAQLFFESTKFQFPVICGDFNKNEFSFFEKFDETPQVTFPSTGEHLDHLLVFKNCRNIVFSGKTTYFSEVNFSDHLPVLFEVCI